MKLTITATDKPKQKHFHYQLEMSERQVMTMVICATVLAYSAVWPKSGRIDLIRKSAIGTFRM